MTGSTPSTIRDQLIRDHDDLDANLDALVHAFEIGDWPVAREAFGRFECAFNDHLAHEEQLFPDFARAFPREAVDLMDEHTAIRRRIEELGLGIEVHQTRVTAIAQLASMIRRHASREDRLLYRWADNEPVTSEPTTQFVHTRSPAPPVRS